MVSVVVLILLKLKQSVLKAQEKLKNIPIIIAQEEVKKSNVHKEKSYVKTIWKGK